jgi:hypothetical protein
MRKLFTLITVTLITGSVFAGGLVTNNNHSVMFTVCRTEMHPQTLTLSF